MTTIRIPVAMVLTLVVTCALMGPWVADDADAHDATMAERGAAVAPTQEPSVDDNDDTRVEVQLVVAGIAAATVVGIGTAAYLLRKKLGLVAPPPEQGADAHH